MELAELELPLVVCCFSKFVAELEESRNSGCAVSEAVRPDPFLATFDRMEQLLNDAEFFTCVALLMLNGTVQDELNEADRCTGTVESVVPFVLPFCCDCTTGLAAAALLLPIIVTVECCDDCCREPFDTSDDEEEYAEWLPELIL